MTSGTEADPAAWGVKLHSAQFNGIRHRWADTAAADEEETLPAVLLMHGWPESWFSWRHQLKALREAGYRGIAPDMRGFGGTGAPAHCANYNVYSLAGDMLALLQHLGIARVAVVGHDHGAGLGWKLALLHPDTFVCYMAMSVPWGGRGKMGPLTALRAAFGDERKPEEDPNFFYIIHHNLPHAAADYAQDTRAALRVLYTDPSIPEAEGAPVRTPKLFVNGRSEPIWRRQGTPSTLPKWLSEEEFEYYVREFQSSGWDGGLNWYRVIDLDWEATPQLSGMRLQQPVAFVAGSRDMVLSMAGGKEKIIQGFARSCAKPPEPLLFIAGAGHWVQPERPAEVNAALLSFLREHCAAFSGPAAKAESRPLRSRL